MSKSMSVVAVGSLFAMAVGSASAFAMSPAAEAMFCQLKNDPDAVSRIVGRPDQVGTVCEEVTRLELFKEFPASRFIIRNGVEYWTNDQPKHPQYPRGELDVVVFDGNTEQAVFVAEVKCPLPEEMGWLLDKAHKQTVKYHHAVDGQMITEMSYTAMSGDGTVDPQAFYQTRPTMVTVGPLGARQYGFQRELPFTRAEMFEMADIMTGRSSATVECE